MKYKKGWLVKRVKESAKEYDTWPDSWKKALKLEISSNTKK